MKQINGYTKVQYSGKNMEKLGFVGSTRRYDSNEWFTFIQAGNAGLKVKPNERGVKLIRVVRVQNTKTRRMEDKFVFFYIFNKEQLEK